ncbi:conserved hypothetical protein [Vibrio chagasii]|nr:conserved hypothetical protein [Vibrio chagasii]CAH7038127.1 conserved hypothetical protein [Vibrio chagasii]CAH7178535.1 conserved hypothetical protein [Vibrio chagasii]CAH7252489.1 conserved hypothetical protein [Vibrio chagasii]CAH7277497.1 conserved hypothetical protein [Vibrio chagasii]
MRFKAAGLYQTNVSVKNKTALCPVLYGSKSHERIRGLLNFETTDYPKK